MRETKVVKRKITKTPFIISDRLSEILNKMDNKISKDILSMSLDKVNCTISYVDIDDSNIGYLTYLPAKKAEYIKSTISTFRSTLLSTSLHDINIFDSNGKVSIRVNKLIRKITLDKYTNHEIEKFGNEFISKIKNNGHKFKIVYGEDIRYWYNHKTYNNVYKGTLSSSCMRYESNQPYFDIYCDNTPDSGAHSHVGLLILIDENNKLIGRALVWFNSIRPEPGRVFMDRIYYTNEYDVDKFIDYAKENNWLYKYQQTYNNNEFIDPKTNKRNKIPISFRLLTKKYKRYPYLDTLSFYTPETGRISSFPNKNKSLSTIIIKDVHGGYRLID
jgi:hypothetical protein